MSRFDFFQVANPESTTLATPTFDIFNYNSGIDNFYRMTAPFQLTQECCSGTGANDTLTITNVTGDQSDSNSVPMAHFLVYNNTRPLHHHDFYELMIVLEGEVMNRIEDKEYAYGAGTCCLMNRNVRHAEKLCGPARLLFVSLMPDFVAELLGFYKTGLFKGELESLNDVALRFMETDMRHPGKKDYLFFLPVFQNDSEMQRLHEISNQLFQTAQAPRFGVSFLVRGLICSLIQFISAKENYHVTEINLDSQGDFLLFLKISHLLENKNGRMTRQELAECCNYSGTHVNRIVQKYSGMNLFDYSMTFCMKKAASLLLETEKSITDIMHDLDFTNTNHFYQIFKKHYGMTPMKYRKASR